MSRRRNRVALAEGRATVSTLEHSDVTVARLEHTGLVVGGDVPPATHNVVDVLALSSSLFSPASTDAELVVRHKVRPLADEERFAIGRRVSGGVEDTSDRVTQIVGTVRIELSSIVTLGDQDAGEVTHTGHLNVVPRPDKVSTLDGAVRNETRSVSISGAVSDTLTLLLSDGTILGRSPKTKVFERVEVGRLATRVLVPSVAGARVVARLGLATGSSTFAGFDTVGTHVLVRKLRNGVCGFGLPLRPRLGGLVAVQVGGSARVGTVAGTCGLLSRDAAGEQSRDERYGKGDSGHNVRCSLCSCRTLD